MALLRYGSEEAKNIANAEKRAKQSAALDAFLAKRKATTDIDALALQLSNFQTATNLSLAGKEPTITAGTTGQFWRGDKTWQPISINDVTGLSSSLSGLSSAAAAKVAKAGDTMTGPLVMPTYLKAALPSASTFARSMIYVSDLTGGAEFCFSDGTNWRRMTDRSIAN